MINAITRLRTTANETPETTSGAARSVALKTELLYDPMPESKKHKAARKIALPTMEGICFEKVKDIAFLEASGNYTVLHFKDKRQTLVCKTLREVELMLPEEGFSRIHRSHTVHVRHIKKYVRGKGGHVLLQNGTTLTVSAGQKDSFLETLKTYYGF